MLRDRHGEMMSSLDPMLEACQGRSSAQEQSCRCLGSQPRQTSASLPSALLQIREVSPNKCTLHLKANLQSLHHQDRADVLLFFVVVSPPLCPPPFQPTEKQVAPRTRCWGDLLGKVMQAASHHIYCDKWLNIQRWRIYPRAHLYSNAALPELRLSFQTALVQGQGANPMS